MKQEHYIPPEYGKEAFHCPHCSVYAQQTWCATLPLAPGGSTPNIDILKTVICNHCNKYSFWVDEKLIHPAQTTVPLAHKDMPKSVSEYYNEARLVSASSNRAAAALLRIAAKKLCEELGEKEPNLNRAIGNLKKRGLPENIIKSLDTVRIVGNEGGAHEGQIDLSGEDSKEIVDKLFWLINFIVEKTIAEPKDIENAFQSLPEDKKQGVEDRDAGK